MSRKHCCQIGREPSRAAIQSEILACDCIFTIGDIRCSRSCRARASAGGAGAAAIELTSVQLIWIKSPYVDWARMLMASGFLEAACSKSLHPLEVTMSEVTTETPNSVIVWPSNVQMAVSVRQIEDMQSAIRDEIALFDALQATGSDWMVRRQEALETGLKALSMMSSSQTASTAASIWGEWMCGSAKRINEDIAEAFGFSIKAAAATQKMIQTAWSSGPVLSAPAASASSH